MARILMIGAGIGQLFLSRKIKERGDELVAVTLPGHLPVIGIADKVHYHDVFDKEGVLQIASEEGVDGVISDQNDTMMPTVAYVAEKMNLPGLRIEQVDAYCNKNRFRDICDRLDIPVPRHVAVHDVVIPDEFARIPFPWIVKPADSQSSIGVQKVNDEQEYLQAMGRALDYSRTHTAILEEFFEGQEIVAEGFIYKGEYYSLGFADRKYFISDKFFIPSQTIFPSVADSGILSQILVSEKNMAGFVKPEFAIVHSEYLYNAVRGEYRVVESALRGGGVNISSHLVPLYSGIDINEILLDCVCGKNIDIEAALSKREDRASGYVCFYLPEGVITGVSGIDAVRSMDFVRMMCVDDVKVGESSVPLTHKGQRMGPVIVDGVDRGDIDNNIRQIMQTIDVTVIGKDGKKYGVIWE